MSIKVMTWVWDHSPATGTDHMVLLAIADAADDDGTNAWPSEATLAHKARVSERTVRRSLRALEELGVLTVELHEGGRPETRRDRRPNRYTVRMTTGQIDRPDIEREDTQGQNGRTSTTERADTVVRRTVLDPSVDPSLVNTPSSFDAFWSSYPRKVGKEAARKAWKAALKRDVPPSHVVSAADDYRIECHVRQTEPQFIPHPATWLNAGRYDDDPTPAVQMVQRRSLSVGDRNVAFLTEKLASGEWSG